MRMVHQGAASSIVHRIVIVPPPFCPIGEDATLALALVVGGIAEHMILEPPTKFTEKVFPIIWDWLQETSN